MRPSPPVVVVLADLEGNEGLEGIGDGRWILLSVLVFEILSLVVTLLFGCLSIVWCRVPGMLQA